MKVSPSLKRIRSVLNSRMALVFAFALLAVASAGVFGSAGVRADPLPPVPTPDRALVLSPGGGEPGRLLAPSWQRPEPGWLLVLDVNRLQAEGQILLVDVLGGTVKGVLRTGQDPAFALSPDGSRLFVAAQVGGQDSLDVIDMATSKSIARYRLTSRRADTLPPVTSTMGVSADGNWVYVVTNEILAPGIDRAGITAVEVATGRTVSTPIAVGTHCGPAVLVVTYTPTIVCSDAVRTFGPQPGAATTVTLPANRDVRKDWNGNPFDIGVLSGGAAADAEHVLAVAGNGRISRVSTRDQRVAMSADLAIGADRWVLPGRVVGSHDGSRVYVGVGRFADRSDATGDQILVVEAFTLRTLAVIDVPGRYATFTVSADGKRVYTVDLAGQTSSAWDTTTTRRLGSISGLGESPTLATAIR